MTKLLSKLGSWAYRRKWWVIAAWVVIFATVAGLAAGFMRPFTSQFEISGTPAIEATEDLVEKFPEGGNPVEDAAVRVAVKAPEGEKLTDPENYQRVQDLVAGLEENLEGELVEPAPLLGNPVDLAGQMTAVFQQVYGEFGVPEEVTQADIDNLKPLSDDETIGYFGFTLDVPTAAEVTDEHRAAITDALEQGRESGLQVEAGGLGFAPPIEINATSEIVGIGVALVVLVFTFGSLVAAGLPVLTGVIGVLIGLAGILLTTSWAELNEVTPTLAIMIGLAVGIDYALFILSRYRSERRDNGLSGPAAAGKALGTAGSAVLFAGVVVIVALAALVVARIEFLSAMGLLAAMTVLIAVLVALTLLPALLGALGDKAFKGRLPGVAGNPKRDGSESKLSQGKTLGGWWIGVVRRLPVVVLVVVIAALGALTIPVSKLELALPTDVTASEDTTQRRAADLMAEGFGEGANAPFLAVVDTSGVDPTNPETEQLRGAVGQALAANPEAVAQAGEELQAQDPEETVARLAAYLYTAGEISQLDGVEHAQLIGLNDDGTAGQVQITPTTGPVDEATNDLVHELRDVGERIEGELGIHIGFTGLTAVEVDITEALAGAMPIYLGIVVGLAVLLLIVVFRSIVVPLLAGVGFLLSVGAAFGVTILFWQEGLWGIVDAPAPLVSFMPIFLIGVTFGLAMDYQVFLGTRMREQFIDNRDLDSQKEAVVRSVTGGFTQGARVVTAAALIMMAVFFAFTNQPLPFIQIFGFALGLAVLFDAFFVRMALVPAAMILFGKATWWFPKWLDKILPSLDVEGRALEEDDEDGDSTGGDGEDAGDEDESRGSAGDDEGRDLPAASTQAASGSEHTEGERAGTVSVAELLEREGDEPEVERGEHDGDDEDGSVSVRDLLDKEDGDEGKPGRGGND